MTSLTFVVTPTDTALAVGSGDVPVLGTPRLIAWLEAATVAATHELYVDPLATGQTSVGTRVDVEHSAATPVGARVTVTADLAHRDGRLLRFTVSAQHDVGDGDVVVAQGTITRVVVDRERFITRSVPSMFIRTAVPVEWDEIGEMCVTSYSQGTGFPLGSDGYAGFLRDVAGRAGNGELLVAVADGEIVGTVTVIPGGDELAEVARPGEYEFRFMAVSPVAWRRGVGRALLDAVIARAGSAPIACYVIDGNAAAMGLYESVGFVREPARDRMISAEVGLRAFLRG